MKPDVKEIAFRLYQEYMSEDFEDFEGTSDISIGAIYFKIINKKPVHYLLLRQISDKYYECLKLSSFYEFATEYDVFYNLKIENQTYIVQTDINFYLSSDEIKKSILLESLPEKYFKELKKFINLSEDDKIDYKGFLQQGFFYPVGNKWIKAFKQKELDIVKDYHLRIFEILDELE